MTDTPSPTPLAGERAGPSSGGGIAREDAVCGICFTELHPVDNPRGKINTCEHLFCAYCIKEWAKNTNVCPLCKARFTRIVTKIVGGEHPGETEEVTKVRRRNYRLWEEDDSSDEDDAAHDPEEAEEANDLLDDALDQLSAGGDAEAADDVARLIQESLTTQQGESGLNRSRSGRRSHPTVSCYVCRGSDNAARMILCDRRQCTYTAHLDCLELTERPSTFLCASCSALRGAPERPPDVATPEAAPSAESNGKPTAVVARHRVPEPQESASGSTRPTAQVVRERPQTILTADAVAEISSCPASHRVVAACSPTRLEPLRSTPLPPPPAVEEDSVPYFLRPNEFANAAVRDLEQRKERAASSSTDAAQRKRKRAAADIEAQEPASSRAINWRSGPVAPQRNVPKSGSTAAVVARSSAPPAELPLDILEAKLVRKLFAEMLPICHRNRTLSESRLLLDADGNTVASGLPSPMAVAARDESIREEAMTKARRMAADRVAVIAHARRAEVERQLHIKAVREAAALAKLARIIAGHRIKQ